MLEKLKYRFNQEKVAPGSIEDVYDGRLYKTFSGPCGFLSSASNIYLCLATLMALHSFVPTVMENGLYSSSSMSFHHYKGKFCSST